MAGQTQDPLKEILKWTSEILADRTVAPVGTVSHLNPFASCVSGISSQVQLSPDNRTLSSATRAATSIAVGCSCSVLIEGINDVTGFAFGQVVDSNFSVENPFDPTFQLRRRESLTLSKIEQVLHLFVGGNISVGIMIVAVLVRLTIPILRIGSPVVRRFLDR